MFQIGKSNIYVRGIGNLCKPHISTMVTVCTAFIENIHILGLTRSVYVLSVDNNICWRPLLVPWLFGHVCFVVGFNFKFNCQSTRQLRHQMHLFRQKLTISFFYCVHFKSIVRCIDASFRIILIFYVNETVHKIKEHLFKTISINSTRQTIISHWLEYLGVISTKHQNEYGGSIL